MKNTTTNEKKSAVISMSLGQPKVTNTTNILDIDVPKALENNVKTGYSYIDAMFAGDGITPSTAAILTGIPGAGKSTLAMQLADRITGTGNIAIYNSGEESIYQIRKTCRRLGLSHGFIPSYCNTVQEIIRKATAIQKANPRKQVFLFVDSLQTVEYERPKGIRGRAPNPGNTEVKVIQALTQWAKETYGIVIIIGQVTKKGEFAGKQSIKHICDCHLHLEVDTDRKSETYGQRIAGMEKNRFGIAGQLFPYEICATGLVFEQSTAKDNR